MLLLNTVSTHNHSRIPGCVVAADWVRLWLCCRCAFKNCQHLEEPGCCFCRDFDRHAAYWVVYHEVRLLYIMSTQQLVQSSCSVLIVNFQQAFPFSPRQSWVLTAWVSAPGIAISVASKQLRGAQPAGAQLQCLKSSLWQTAGPAVAAYLLHLTCDLLPWQPHPTYSACCPGR